MNEPVTMPVDLSRSIVSLMAPSRSSQVAETSPTSAKKSGLDALGHF